MSEFLDSIVGTFAGALPGSLSDVSEEIVGLVVGRMDVLSSVSLRVLPKEQVCFRPTAGTILGEVVLLLHEVDGLAGTWDKKVVGFTCVLEGIDKVLALYGRLVVTAAASVVLVVDDVAGLPTLLSPWLLGVGSNVEDSFLHTTSGCFSGWIFI